MPNSLSSKAEKENTGQNLLAAEHKKLWRTFSLQVQSLAHGMEIIQEIMSFSK
ncbi:MAG: hypothetical protein HGA96_15270 [Desulfobulbaceae bacterium]|nr:hypothetical protein [Desulfobulbaceae bacterium]